ncbi:MAG: flagellar hook capping FlgD N-terminal domain-containing protein [Candidatus Nanopelagicales bacterium]
MTVDAVAAPKPGLLPSSTAPTAANTADKNTFMELLVAQLRYQDPMNPTDSSAFLAQSAQFTALEKMQAVADQTAQLLAAQMAFGASSLVGRTVTYPSDAAGTQSSGVVESVRFDATGPVLVVEGTDVAVGTVRSVTTT